MAVFQANWRALTGHEQVCAYQDSIWAVPHSLQPQYFWPHPDFGLDLAGKYVQLSQVLKQSWTIACEDLISIERGHIPLDMHFSISKSPAWIPCDNRLPLANICLTQVAMMSLWSGWLCLCRQQYAIIHPTTFPELYSFSSCEDRLNYSSQMTHCASNEEYNFWLICRTRHNFRLTCKIFDLVNRKRSVEIFVRNLALSCGLHNSNETSSA